MGWACEALAAHVDELAARRESFVSEIRTLSERLDARERELLGRLLLERARGDAAHGLRLEERSWLRRVWRRADARSERSRS